MEALEKLFRGNHSNEKLRSSRYHFGVTAAAVDREWEPPTWPRPREASLTLYMGGVYPLTNNQKMERTPLSMLAAYGTRAAP